MDLRYALNLRGCLMQGSAINKSLLTLGNVIRALGDGKVSFCALPFSSTALYSILLHAIRAVTHALHSFFHKGWITWR